MVGVSSMCSGGAKCIVKSHKEMGTSGLHDERSRRKGGRRKGGWPWQGRGRGKGGGKKGGKKGAKGGGRVSDSGEQGEEDAAGKKVNELDICILTWNADGFGERGRQLLILSCLWSWGVDIAVLTESHLRDEDIFYGPPGSENKEGKRVYTIKMDNYLIDDWRNRDASEVPIGGVC